MMFTPYKMMFTLHTLMFTPHNIMFSGNRCVVESRSEPADPRRRSHVPVDAGKEEEKDINRRFRVELHVHATAVPSALRGSYHIH